MGRVHIQSQLELKDSDKRGEKAALPLILKGLGQECK